MWQQDQVEHSYFHILERQAVGSIRRSSAVGFVFVFRIEYTYLYWVVAGTCTELTPGAGAESL